MSRVWPSLIGALALAMPSVPAVANGISVAFCGQPGLSITIPFNNRPMMPDHGCCKGACHAGCERKSQRHGRGGNTPDGDGDGES